MHKKNNQIAFGVSYNIEFKYSLQAQFSLAITAIKVYKATILKVKVYRIIFKMNLINCICCHFCYQSNKITISITSYLLGKITIQARRNITLMYYSYIFTLSGPGISFLLSLFFILSFSLTFFWGFSAFSLLSSQNLLLEVLEGEYMMLEIEPKLPEQGKHATICPIASGPLYGLVYK